VGVSAAGGGDRRRRVALFGATGVVGQRLVRRLAAHPDFELVAVAASERSAGRRYGEAVRWRLPEAVPPATAHLPVREIDELAEADGYELALSALDAGSARRIEPRLVARGLAVVSNASAHRLAEDVPLVVPEVNADHLELARVRPVGRGLLAANPNCAAIGLVLALAPLAGRFGVARVRVTTLQAASGAGHPGVPSLDLLGNVVPGIDGEEEKLETEPAKIFGRRRGGRVEPAALAISADTHRVPVVDGHLLSVSVGLGERVTIADAERALDDWRPPADVAALPSAPARALERLADGDRPQPRLDAGRGGGLTVTVGRLRLCPLLDLRFTALVHNAERGAAGGTLLLAELAARRGLLAGAR
jgi:aspartate-semialdehyde dehydrogenase